jgi:hypothetical protein
MTTQKPKLIVYLVRELTFFWKYLFAVAVVYAIIFFFANFSILLFSLDWLTPLMALGGAIFAFKIAVGWRKYLHQTGRRRG